MSMDVSDVIAARAVPTAVVDAESSPLLLPGHTQACQPYDQWHGKNSTYQQCWGLSLTLSLYFTHRHPPLSFSFCGPEPQ
jgi:hypothetical protein